MTAVLKGVASLIGLGSTPKVNAAPAQATVQSAQDQAALARGALFQTAGGAAGSDLSPGQVQNSRATLFGN